MKNLAAIRLEKARKIFQESQRLPRVEFEAALSAYLRAKLAVEHETRQ